MLFTRICGGSFSSSAPGSLFNHWLLICIARFESGRVFVLFIFGLAYDIIT
nr:MAG TPA: hypothetical protein [Caudoviricetes sp.]